MKLPISIGKKKEKKEYFLALLLRDEKATAVIFEEVLGKVNVIGEHEERFSTSIEEITNEEWLDVLDKTISQAEGALPDDVQTQKTVFGVKESWVENARIKKEYLTKLKKLSEALGLSPIGFLVVPEAIAHLLSKEEGAPVSAILIELGKKSLTASLIRAGRVIETKSVHIEESPAKTTDQLLHTFTAAEVFPSRIIIFNELDYDHLVQDFLGYSWSKQLPFLHVPQITSLPKRFDARAILFGAATQMGLSMTIREATHLPIKEVPTAPEPDEEDEEIEEKDEIKEETIVSDNLKLPDDKPAVAAHHKKDEKESSPAEFGFMKEQDIAEMEEAVPTHAVESQTEKAHHAHHAEEHEEHQTGRTMHAHNAAHEDKEQPIPRKKEANKKSLVALPLGMLAGISSMIKSISFGSLKTIRLPFLAGMAGSKFIFIPPIVIGVIILLVLFYIFGIKADVTIRVTPKIVEQQETITFVTDEQSNFADNIVQAETISVDQTGSVSTSATGKKEVGEKAKGNVTLYSRLTSEKTFPAGTTITSSNGLQFTLDELVKVASASADASAAPTTAKVNVTAVAIGKEQNLPSGTRFTIAGLNANDIVAKNDNAFSGGSKKEVTVIAKKDVDKLLADLPKNLEEKAKEEMQSKISGDSALLPVTVDATVTEQNLDKKVGDEASSVTLKGTVTFEGIAYKKSVLTDFAKEKMKSQITDQDLAKDGVTVEVEKADQDKSTVMSDIVLKANLLPKIDEKKMSQEIAGKSFDEVRSSLTKTPQVASVAITLQPNIPFLPQVMPRMANNIAVRIEQ